MHHLFFYAEFFQVVGKTELLKIVKKIADLPSFFENFA